jgi:serine/threonine protein kinase
LEITGKILSSFKVTEKLGQGSMGLVYKCVNKNSGTIGAVKFIDEGSCHLSGTGNELQTLINRFYDEAQSVSSIKSTHIVKSLGSGLDPELGNYIIMEYLSGKSLEERLKEGPLPEKLWFNMLAIPLLMGLSDLHHFEILHRDIKPSNLISDSSGSYKISDFGLAVFKGRQAKTKTGFITGTPGYLAPEMFTKSIESISENGPSSIFLSDLYSAGIVLIEALTGIHPFRKGNIAETFKYQMSYKPTGSSLQLDGSRNEVKIPLQIATVLAKAVSLKPEDRFQSGGSFLENLEKAVLSVKKMSRNSFKKTLFSVSPVIPANTQECPANNLQNNSLTKDLSATKDLSSRKDSTLTKDPPVRKNSSNIEKTSKKNRLSDDKTISFVSIKTMKRAVPLLLLPLIVIFALFLYEAGSEIRGGGNSVTEVLANNKDLASLVKDFKDATGRLSGESFFPQRKAFSEFFDGGLKLNSYILENKEISSSIKRELWKALTLTTEGSNSELISRYVSRCINNNGTIQFNREAHEFAIKALKAYRSSFIKSFNNTDPNASIEFSHYLNGDMWLMEQVFLSSVPLLLEKEYFNHSHDLILDGELFIGKLLPAYPGDGPLSQNLPKNSPPPLWDEAINYRYRLSLWRALIFSGHIPVSPYETYRSSDHRAFLKEQYVALFDSAHTIVEVLRHLGNQPPSDMQTSKSSPLLQKTEIDMAEFVYKLLIDDKESFKAINKSKDIIDSIEAPNEESTGTVFRKDLITSVDVPYTYIRNTADEIFTGQNVMTVVMAGESEKKRLWDTIQGATVLGQRSIWHHYTLSFFQNTIISRNSYFNSAPIKLTVLLRAFLPYIEGPGNLGQPPDRSNISPAFNERSLPEMVIQLAVLSVKSSRPELLWPLSDGTYKDGALNNHYNFVSDLNPILKDLLHLASEKNGNFKNVFKNFYSLWNGVFLPTLDSHSVMYMFLKSYSSLFAGITPAIVPDEERQSNLDEAIIVSGKLFEQIKNGIEKNGGESCSYEPHLLLLSEVILLRWPLLRRCDRNDELLAEALWVQKTFNDTIEETFKIKDEGSTRARIYSSAAVNVGHVYLKQKDLKAKALVLNSNRDVLEEVKIVLNRVPLN